MYVVPKKMQLHSFLVHFEKVAEVVVVVVVVVKPMPILDFKTVKMSCLIAVEIRRCTYIVVSALISLLLQR